MPKTLGTVGAGGDFLARACAILSRGHVAGTVYEQRLHEGRWWIGNTLALHQPLADEGDCAGGERGCHACSAIVEVVRVGRQDAPSLVCGKTAANRNNVGARGDDVGLDSSILRRPARRERGNALRNGGLRDFIAPDGIGGISGNVEIAPSIPWKATVVFGGAYADAVLGRRGRGDATRVDHTVSVGIDTVIAGGKKDEEVLVAPHVFVGVHGVIRILAGVGDTVPPAVGVYTGT